MLNRKHLVRFLGVTSLGVLAAVALAAGSVSSNGPSVDGGIDVGNMPSLRPSKVIGRVVSADPDADLKGVHIALVRDGKAVQRTITNDNGQFVFETVRPGRFGVAASKRGVGAGRELGAVKPGETARVQIQLKARPE